MINIPNKISVHCSVTPDSMDIGFAEIDAWHKLEPFKFLDEASGISCGYHYIVRQDGTIELGRPVTSIPAAVRGYNTNSIAICWIGLNQPTMLQTIALMDLIAKLSRKHGINSAMILGHTEYPGVKKTCPNLPMHLVRLYVQRLNENKEPPPAPPEVIIPKQRIKMSFWRRIKFIFFS